MKRSVSFLFAAAFALAACGSGPAVKLDPESRAFYENTRLIMNDDEIDIFKHLPDAEARKEFIQEFWEKRDPDPDTEVNEAKVEFDTRLDYVNKRFREGRKGIATDRGRIYLLLGPPEKIEAEPFLQAGGGGELLWVYYKYELGIYFVDPNGTGSYTIGTILGNLFEAIEMAKLGETFTERSAPKNFTKFGLAYDKDRHELRLTIPSAKLGFASEGGALAAEFDFTFYIYKEGGAKKEMFLETQRFRGKSEDLEKKPEIAFTFTRELPAGVNFVDVIVDGKEANGRVRKIFKIVV